MGSSSFSSNSHRYLEKDYKESSKPTSESSLSTSGNQWCMNHPDMKRRGRIAIYNMYTVEGKIKSNFKKIFRWIKGVFSHV